MTAIMSAIIAGTRVASATAKRLVRIRIIFVDAILTSAKFEWCESTFVRVNAKN